ncbi:hypothetical protein K490DRAFT_64235 [Saccharata proteae CBS 121410]|uniref:Amino acid permease/ SLC12A domain-containing protein n=1 Tax=Saccharata proteae CBS 121410 TaxID=1314787 RepID=A0A6A5YDV2_9PEZI|nr:hypothetical protein K490DRAFT_64235 [Saccharata proteae CBS 121410]
MIVVSTTIGTGFFSSAAEILAVAGPGMTLLAFAIVGLVACMTMEGISEMVIIWPVPSPMVEFVSHFVDSELAVVVGFAYWYTYAITFSAIVATSGTLVQYWTTDATAEVLIYILFPIIVLLINYNDVSLFGWIELFGGCAKLLIVLIVFLTMIVINLGGGPGPAIHNKCIEQGIIHQNASASTGGVAALISVNLAIWPYIGVEAITVTAYEALNPRELKGPAKNIAWIVTVIYAFSVLGSVLDVQWTNGYLPRYYDQGPRSGNNITCLNYHINRGTDSSGTTSSESGSPSNATHSIPVIAIDQAGISGYGSVVNGFLLYCALSTANSALFVASRTLYGLGQRLNDKSESRIVRSIARFGKVNEFGVPHYAILASMVFAWVPLLSLSNGSHARDTQQILINVGSTSCVLVWASQSWAFIRYDKWLRKWVMKLSSEEYQRYNRFTRSDFSSLLGPTSLQPLLAWLSLFLSVFIVLVLGSAGMWNHQNLAVKALNIYLGPLLCLVLFVALKISEGRDWKKGWVRLGEWNELRDTLDELTDMVSPAVQRRPSHQMEAPEQANGTIPRTHSAQAPKIHLQPDHLQTSVDSPENQSNASDEARTDSEHLRPKYQ